MQRTRTADFAAGAGRRRSARGGAFALLQWLRAGLARRRQRQALAALDDRLLRDVGLTRCEAGMEAAKPFWLP